MKFEIGAMSVGDILDRGLRLLLARLPTFYVINLIVMVPLLVFLLAIPAIASAGADPTGAQVALLSGGVMGVLLITLILQPIATAAILHVISGEFIDKRVGIGEALGFALRRFLKLLGASILAGLAIGVGFILCIAPGIIFWIWYAFVAQVVVVEGLGGGKALARSKDLGEGYRGRILALIGLIILINLIFYAAASVLERVLPSTEQVPIEWPAEVGFRPQEPMQTEVINYRNYAINQLASQLVGILVQTFQAVCFTLMYFDLRIRKEGYDLELAARQQERPTYE